MSDTSFQVHLLSIELRNEGDGGGLLDSCAGAGILKSISEAAGDLDTPAHDAESQRKIWSIY
jgi:hypothetical protein